jgi:hypothetical protein
MKKVEAIVTVLEVRGHGRQGCARAAAWYNDRVIRFYCGPLPHGRGSDPSYDREGVVRTKRHEFTRPEH